jgi:Tetratricopeptide repeat
LRRKGMSKRSVLIVASPFIAMALVSIGAVIYYLRMNEEFRYGARQSRPPIVTQIGMGKVQRFSPIVVKGQDLPDNLIGDESKEFAQLYQNALEDIGKGWNALAEELLRKAVSEAKRSKNTKALLLALRKLESVLYMQEKYKEADGLDKQISRLVAATQAPTQSAAGESKDPKISAVAKTSAEPKVAAEPTADTAKKLEPQDDRIARLAMVCHKNGQCDTAVSLLEHSIAISERVHGKKSLKTAERMSELASLYMALDQPKKAQSLIEKVMEIKGAQNSR